VSKMIQKRVRPHVEVLVESLPDCDMCKSGFIKRKARYDGRTRMGPWAYMCKVHFRLYGVGLGLGRGQKLVVGK